MVDKYIRLTLFILRSGKRYCVSFSEQGGGNVKWVQLGFEYMHCLTSFDRSAGQKELDQLCKGPLTLKQAEEVRAEFRLRHQAIPDTTP